MGVSVSVERLRRWLLAGAGLLVAVIVAFLGYAHYRAHRLLAALPEKLGADIRQETNAFTYSQSEGGRTIYTIHASKAIQHKDGRYTLHDVGIVLYGRKGDRADRIYGSEFDYDQKDGVVRAMGEVHLDLQAPAATNASAKMDYAAGKDLETGHEADSAHLIHVTTSGLVYLQKLGVAATDQPIEFEAGGMKGQAIGADYTADSGVLVLHKAVKMAGIEQGRPAELTADRAELDRDNQKITLATAKYVSIEKTGAPQAAQAEHAVVHLRSDGTVESVNADGAVTLKGTEGTVTAPRGVVTLNADNDPQSALLTGGVVLGADGPLRKAQGGSSEAKLAFDKIGRPEQMLLTGSVQLHEQLRPSATQTAWSERQLNANQVQLALATNPAGKTFVRDAKASGGAALAMMNPVVQKDRANKNGRASGKVSSSLTGDVLTAHFTEANGTQHLAEVRGEGHASLRKVNATGAVDTSSADSLVALFQPAKPKTKHPAQGGFGADEIASATEQGHVVLTQTPAKKTGAATPQEERATAERLSYDGALERTTLTGNVQVSDADSVLWADRVIADQKTGDATADGSVKVSYVEPKSAKGTTPSTEEPVHVLAARADLKHDSGVATFYAMSGQRARLWQGASQVEAPVIQFDRKQKRMVAHGAGQGAPMAVRAVLTSTARPSNKPDKSKSPAKTNVFEITSRELTYSDAKREADFTGGIEVTSADGKMRGQQAEVFLQQPGKPTTGTKAAVQGGFIGGSVERMVASGDIVIDQQGRRATGQQVVYTANDGTFALTGTPSAPPQVVDDQRGTVTGTLLQFRAGDESVVVSNGGNGSAGRVRTQTQVKKLR